MMWNYDKETISRNRNSDDYAVQVNISRRKALRRFVDFKLAAASTYSCPAHHRRALRSTMTKPIERADRD
jgi:hypothetical protein